MIVGDVPVGDRLDASDARIEPVALEQVGEAALRLEVIRDRNAMTDFPHIGDAPGFRLEDREQPGLDGEPGEPVDE